MSSSSSSDTTTISILIALALGYGWLLILTHGLRLIRIKVQHLLFADPAVARRMVLDLLQQQVEHQRTATTTSAEAGVPRHARGHRASAQAATTLPPRREYRR